MTLVQRGHPGFSEEQAAEDHAYLEEIGPTITILMQKTRNETPGLDYFLMAIEEEGGCSEVQVLPRREGISAFRKELAAQPNSIIQDIVDKIETPPSAPSARWIILCRNRTFRLCSVVDVDVSGGASA
jgi:hypothetical protein